MLNLANQTASSAMIVVEIFVCLIIILVEIPLHECAHGWAAKALGDPTPEKSGRLSLNPFLHVDIMGTLAVMLFGFGWGRPIPVNPFRCSKTRPRIATAIIALAGPLAKLYLYYTTIRIVSISIYLAVFNLLPVPPFDGARFFMAFLPTKLFIRIMRYERAIMMVIMLMFLFGVFSIPMSFLSTWISKGLFYDTGYVEFFMGV